jgi:molecular chaperone IbpA
MTNQLTLRSINFPDIHKFAVGFDSMFDEFTKVRDHGNYPPYNVIKYTEDKFAIEVAVAGFKEGDIEIQVEKNQLVVKGEQALDINESIEYLHRGISARNFVRSWTLADYVKVQEAQVTNGILTIVLERIVPENEKPKTIAISYNK